MYGDWLRLVTLVPEAYNADNKTWLLGTHESKRDGVACQEGMWLSMIRDAGTIARPLGRPFLGAW